MDGNNNNGQLVIELREMMEKNKWSQDRLAHEINVSFATVNRWFRGHNKMNDKTAMWVRSQLEGL